MYGRPSPEIAELSFASRIARSDIYFAARPHAALRADEGTGSDSAGSFLRVNGGPCAVRRGSSVILAFFDLGRLRGGLLISCQSVGCQLTR